MCQFMTQPTNLHMCHVKHILKYLKGTLHHGIAYSQGSMVVTGFVTRIRSVIPTLKDLPQAMLYFLGRILYLGLPRNKP